MTKVTLLDLPVVPPQRDLAAIADLVKTAYLSENKGIQTAEAWTKFIERWTNLWLLPNKPGLPAVLRGDYDMEEALAILQRLYAKDDSVVPAGGEEPSIEYLAAVDIVLPEALLRAEMLAHHYGVGTDLALVRLYLDPYPEHENELR